jgi:tRNA-splicing ligase RtcB
MNAWIKTGLEERFNALCAKHPKIKEGATTVQLGTLGGGNHFIEVCLDTENRVWVMLHSGSRGIGNVIGRYFVEKAKERLHTRRRPAARQEPRVAGGGRAGVRRLRGGHAVGAGLRQAEPRDDADPRAPGDARQRPAGVQDRQGSGQFHHNYAVKERHFGEDVYVTRKGAVRAGLGELGIIPGSMGAKSFIVRGKGYADSFCSCSHGAGRAMSRTKAKELFTVEDHDQDHRRRGMPQGRRRDRRNPLAYKDIDA